MLQACVRSCCISHWTRPTMCAAATGRPAPCRLCRKHTQLQMPMLRLQCTRYMQTHSFVCLFTFSLIGPSRRYELASQHLILIRLLQCICTICTLQRSSCCAWLHKAQPKGPGKACLLKLPRLCCYNMLQQHYLLCTYMHGFGCPSRLDTVCTASINCLSTLCRCCRACQ